MAKTTNQKRLNIEEQIKNLENQRRELLKKERAEEESAKKLRHTNRGNIIEKLMPHLATLNEQEFEIFMKKVLCPEPILPSIKVSVPVQEIVEESQYEDD
ncbi:MAG: hypothetical protein FWH07_07135 [Oscillospiraceae bacterium]|nr:hypothetical protein [Oscillospiraceae bacterium]